MKLLKNRSLNLNNSFYCFYRDPNKFKSKDYEYDQGADYIPGESERERRLRLRALERKQRLGSAKSISSAYSNPSKDPPKTYQENVKFPENTRIEMNEVMPARPLNLEQTPEFDPTMKYPQSHKYDQETYDSSIETL